MKKFICCLFTFLIIGLAQGQKKSEIKKPNIILIMVDDMGFADIGSYGSEIKTPNVDKLATEGLRFREFYNNSICAPTRASLITGQYPHRAGMGYFDINLGLPAYQGFLNRESLTNVLVIVPSGKAIGKLCRHIRLINGNYTIWKRTAVKQLTCPANIQRS